MFIRRATIEISDVLTQNDVTKKWSWVDVVKKSTLLKKCDFLPVEAFEYDPDNFIYFRARSITADVPNGNGDYFEELELESSYKSFVGKGFYIEHDSDSIEKAKGIVLDSVWHKEGHYIECLVAVDRKAYADIARQVESGILNSVSMGCFQKDVPVLLSDGTQIPISEVAEGDLVITHKGNVKPVTTVMQRSYGGTLVHIQSFGEPILATPDHPFLAIKKSRVCACGCGAELAACSSTTKRKMDRRWIAGHAIRVTNPMRGEKFTPVAASEPDFVKASELLEGDLLLFPVKSQQAESLISKGMMRLAGYFLAEGCYLKHLGVPSAVQFHLGSHERALIDEIKALLKSEFSVEANEYVSKFKPSSVTIQAYGKEIADWFFKNCGEYSDRKRISPLLISQPPSMLVNLLAGWLNGDGHLSVTGSAKASISGTTVSCQLADQIRYMASVSGIRTSLFCPKKRSDRKQAYIIRFSSLQSRELLLASKWDVKVEFINRSDLRFKNYLCYPVKKVWNEFFVGDVYNLEVADDNSYIAGGVSVHNCVVEEAECSLCHNVAHNQHELCEHMNPMSATYCKGRLMPDGKKAYETNRKVTFSELSGVAQPADIEAHVFEVFAAIQNNLLKHAANYQNIKAKQDGCPDGKCTLDVALSRLSKEERYALRQAIERTALNIQSPSTFQGNPAIDSGAANPKKIMNATPSTTTHGGGGNVVVKMIDDEEEKKKKKANVLINPDGVGAPDLLTEIQEAAKPVPDKIEEAIKEAIKSRIDGIVSMEVMRQVDALLSDLLAQAQLPIMNEVKKQVEEHRGEMSEEVNKVKDEIVNPPEIACAPNEFYGPKVMASVLIDKAIRKSSMSEPFKEAFLKQLYSSMEETSFMEALSASAQIEIGPELALRREADTDLLRLYRSGTATNVWLSPLNPEIPEMQKIALWREALGVDRKTDTAETPK